MKRYQVSILLIVSAIAMLYYLFRPTPPRFISGTVTDKITCGRGSGGRNSERYVLGVRDTTGSITFCVVPTALHDVIAIGGNINIDRDDDSVKVLKVPAEYVNDAIGYVCDSTNYEK